LLPTDAVKCWGEGANGALGYGNTENIGDDELPSSVGVVDVGAAVAELSAGGGHTCAGLADGNVRCWGIGINGQLGYAATETIGDDETPSSAGNVDVGGTVMQVAAGGSHTCALLATGRVRCWGLGFDGRLGYGNTDSIGDDETPESEGDVNVGGDVVEIAAGARHTCALLTTEKHPNRLEM
jgi:alpha-tubulin suppressor-like RCC1 family protein